LEIEKSKDIVGFCHACILPNSTKYTLHDRKMLLTMLQSSFSFGLVWINIEPTTNYYLNKKIA